jgi:hypothetical protein
MNTALVMHSALRVGFRPEAQARPNRSQNGYMMIPLYGFKGLTGRDGGYIRDCSLCGGDQDNWTTLSETQKMVKAILLKAQCEAELNATHQPFQKK